MYGNQFNLLTLYKGLCGSELFKILLNEVVAGVNELLG